MTRFYSLDDQAYDCYSLEEAVIRAHDDCEDGELFTVYSGELLSRPIDNVQINLAHHAIDKIEEEIHEVTLNEDCFIDIDKQQIERLDYELNQFIQDWVKKEQVKLCFDEIVKREKHRFVRETDEIWLPV